MDKNKLGIWFPTVRAHTGVDRFTMNLVRELRKRGVKADITWLPHYVEYAPFLKSKISVPKWANVIHSNSWTSARFLPSSLPSIVTIHSCVHDDALLSYKSVAQRFYHDAWIRRIERRALHQASIVTAVSDYTAKKASQVFGVDDIVVIPNWVDEDVFCFQKQKESASGAFKILYAGNPSVRKGFDLLPEIMAELGEQFELLYTSNSEKAGLTLPSNMRAVRRVKTSKEMALYYRDADVLLLPTRLEGMPLVVLEAMASGLPVVASNCSSLPEVIIPNETGLLCDVDDVGCFVSAIRKLRDDNALAQDISLRARERLDEQYSREMIVERYIELYCSLF